MTVEVLLGDLLKDNSQTLVNTVNCVGVMGKGIALEFRKKYPAMFEDYKKRCRKKEVMPGVPYYYKDFSGNSIINFPTKNHWRSASRIVDIINGLDIFVSNYRRWGIQSVAFPPLGCGNGGLIWEDVGPLMYHKLSKIDIPVRIYAPYSTPKEHLKKEFLIRSKISPEFMSGKVIHKKITLENVALLEVLYQLQNMKYTAPVGRTIFQKISYMLSESGVDIGFKFKQGTYGPYSEDVQNTIKEFSNSNLIVEQKNGSMIKITTGSGYQKVRQKYQNEIVKYKDNIEKVVDLFSRIHNTGQAGEITTVFYVYREFKQIRPYEEISEQMIYDRVVDWKKYWDNEEKRESIANAIRILTMLNWIDVKFSESLPIKEYA